VIIEARIWAGLHSAPPTRKRRCSGRNVAEYMAEHYFQPVG
jgi:hypothetical protein